jgi:hypothetical protein
MQRLTDMRNRLVCSFAFTIMALAADPEPRWRELNRVAREAIQAKDYAKLRETLLQLRPLVPGNPRITYNLAASEAVLGIAMQLSPLCAAWPAWA